MQKTSFNLDPNKLIKNIKALHQSGFSQTPTLQTLDGLLIYGVGNNVILDYKNQQTSLRGHDNIITTIAISPTKKIIVSGQLSSPGNKNYESPILLWSITQEKCLKVLQGLRDGVKKILISRDQNLVASCSMKCQIIIWNLNNGQQVWVKQFENSINLLNLNSDALLFTHAKSLQQANLLPLFQQNKPPQITNYTLPSTGLPRTYLSFCQVSNDKYLLGTQGGQICFFDRGIFKWMENVGKGKVNSILLGDSGSSIFAVLQNQVIKLAITDKKLQQICKRQIHAPQQLVPYTSETYLVQGKNSIFQLQSKNLAGNILKFSHSSRVSAIDTRDNIIASIQYNGITLIRKWSDKYLTAQLISIYQPQKATNGKCINIKSDTTILNGYSDGFVRCINVQGELIWELGTHKNSVTSIFSGNLYMLTGGQDCVVRIWSTQNNKLINQLSVHQKTVSKVLGDATDEKIIHSCSLDKSLHTYDLKADKKINFRQLSNGTLLNMIQIYNNQLVTIGTGMPTCFWDIKSNQPLQSLQSGGIKITSLAINGSILILGTQSGQILQYDTKTKNYFGWYQAHSRQITSLQSLSQNIIISGSDDNSVTIWNI